MTIVASRLKLNIEKGVDKKQMQKTTFKVEKEVCLDLVKTYVRCTANIMQRKLSLVSIFDTVLTPRK